MGGLERGSLERIRDSAPGELSASEYMSLARGLRSEETSLEPLRLVFLSTVTTSLFDPFLRVEGARHGLGFDILHGGFGQFEQVLLRDDWQAEDGVREVLVILMRLDDLDPNAAPRFYKDGGRSFASLGEDAIDRIDATLSLFRDKSQGPAFVANFAPPAHRPLSVFDANEPDSMTYRLHALNRTLLERVSARPGMHIWDYAGLVASRGSLAWTDPRLWALARSAVAANNQPALAVHLARTVRGAMRSAAKCLVLDLDDTLWGGAIGDDGLGGIRLGDEHPGSAFKGFQRAVLGLRDRGIVLAICSKNDAEVAQDAIDNHPEMVLRSSDFASVRINWRPKSENLREIAEELNIGLDSLVFFDDNPVERAEVRERAPEVTVVPVPTDPILYQSALACIAEFDTPLVTAEDQMRAQSYEAQRERHQAKDSAGSLEDFLTSLEMTAEIGPLDGATTQRIGQLVAKTNQFNLTTRRHTQAELEALAARDGCDVYWLRLRDRYGDMGLIAVGIIIQDGSDAVVDSLVLSCRAANRGVEQAMLSCLAERARHRGMTALVGEFIPTARNHVVADLYPRLGFAAQSADDGVVRYRLDLTGDDVRLPDFIRVPTAEPHG